MVEVGLLMPIWSATSIMVPDVVRLPIDNVAASVNANGPAVTPNVPIALIWLVVLLNDAPVVAVPLSSVVVIALPIAWVIDGATKFNVPALTGPATDSPWVVLSDMAPNTAEPSRLDTALASFRVANPPLTASVVAVMLPAVCLMPPSTLGLRPPDVLSIETFLPMTFAASVMSIPAVAEDSVTSALPPPATTGALTSNPTPVWKKSAPVVVNPANSVIKLSVVGRFSVPALPLMVSTFSTPAAPCVTSPVVLMTSDAAFMVPPRLMPAAPALNVIAPVAFTTEAAVCVSAPVVLIASDAPVKAPPRLTPFVPAFSASAPSVDRLPWILSMPVGKSVVLEGEAAVSVMPPGAVSVVPVITVRSLPASSVNVWVPVSVTEAFTVKLWMACSSTLPVSPSIEVAVTVAAGEPMVIPPME